MSIYKDCDIRGIYQKEFDEQDAYQIGRAVGTQYTGKLLAVGGDVRLSTPILKQNLLKGLLESGANVIDIGMVPTPVFYYALHHLAVDGGITVTASHNPPQYNGFKLMFGELPMTPAAIDEIRQLVESGDFARGEGTLTRQNVTDQYRSWMQTVFPAGKKLKVVLDCCNGATGELAPAIFRDLGYEVVPLYCEFDGRFPNRSPNPAVYSNLADLCQKVKETGADLGAGFDGDGDRVVFVDDQGNVVQSERSFALFIDEYLKEKPSSVVYDLKSSSVVRNTVLKHGGEPRMERSGHAFIKRNFLENHSALAGEISGHFFFGELGYDDGIYAAARMGQILRSTGKTVSQLLSGVPQTLITPDIRVFCPYDLRDSWLEKIREMGSQYEVSCIDGVRVQFADGWLLVRKSVTEEGITIRIEADDRAAMDRIRELLVQTLPQTREKIYS